MIQLKILQSVHSLRLLLVYSLCFTFSLHFTPGLQSAFYKDRSFVFRREVAKAGRQGRVFISGSLFGTFDRFSLATKGVN